MILVLIASLITGTPEPIEKVIPMIMNLLEIVNSIHLKSDGTLRGSTQGFSTQGFPTKMSAMKTHDK